MTEQQTRDFLAQFKGAREEFDSWPKWMRDAARTAAATFPKMPASGVPEATAPNTADLRAPATLPESMSRDEILKYYSEYANMVAHEVIGYQRRIRELEAALAAHGVGGNEHQPSPPSTTDGAPK